MYWVRNGVLPNFELLILDIVRQKVQKWVKLGKITVFRLRHVTFFLKILSNIKSVWYWVWNGVLSKFELHILVIVGQNGQKWVKLGKITVFMLKYMTLWLQYYEIASNIWYRVREEGLLKFDLHVFGIVGQKYQNFVKLDNPYFHTKPIQFLTWTWWNSFNMIFVFEKHI